MIKRFSRYAAIAALCLAALACNKDDDSSVALRDYATQYELERVNIENFLKSHAYTGSPDGQGDFNLETDFTEVPSNDPSCMWLDSRLHSRVLTVDEVDYRMYYLTLNQGAGHHPCNVDGVFTAYQGVYLYDSTIDDTSDAIDPVEFETVNYPESVLSLDSAIRGWGELLPQFGVAGGSTQTPGEPISYNDFGAGIMFIPSGMGYYGTYTGTIPSYSTLIFKFKLYALQRADHDGDGIDSWLEDVEPEDGVAQNDPYAAHYMYYYENYLTDDTDGDEIPDYRDVDDDGDNVLTANEIKNETTTDDEDDVFAFDDIPYCVGGNGKHRHLDPTCSGQ